MGKALNIQAGISEYDGIPPLSAFSIPVQDGLAYAGVYSGGATLAEKNFAFTNDGVVVGGVAFGGVGFCTLPNGCFIDTGVKQTLDVSMMAVFRSKDTDGGLGIMGDQEGVGAVGIGLYINPAADGFAQCVIDNDDTHTTTSIALNKGEANFNLIGVSVPADGPAITFNSDYQSVQENSYVHEVTTSGNILIGALPAVNLVQGIDMGVAMVWEKALSAAEIDLMTAWAVEHMSNYGITI